MVVIERENGEVKVNRVTGSASDTAHELCNKYNLKGNKEKTQNDKIVERAAVEIKGPSRNDLMMQAKDKGIKNYRILNKEELSVVLEMKVAGATDEQITTLVINPAVNRWKSGWKKNTEKVEV